MAERPYRGPIDYERIGRCMRALGVPTRLLLLVKLHLPHAPSEIVLPPFRRDVDLRPDRTLSRQTVDQHLEVLEEAGLVRSRPARRGGQPTREYLVDRERLFTLADEVRRLGLQRIAPVAAVAGARISTWSDETTAEVVDIPDGPSLVLVSGPLEGRAFPLAGPGPWILGRAEGTDVTLDYDPFVSARNTTLRREDGRFFVESLPESKNGTTLNWNPLKPGESAALRGGDTIGAGRSLLVARDV